MDCVVMAGAARCVREAAGAPAEIPGAGAGAGRGDPAVDSRRGGAPFSRGGLDGQPDNPAISRGVALGTKAGAGGSTASSGTASAVCGCRSGTERTAMTFAVRLR